MKKILFCILTLLMLSGIFLFISCSVSSPESEIRKFISTRLTAIRDGDLDAYMETVSSSDSYYVNEQRRWFHEMVTFLFMDLRIDLAAIMEIGSDAESGIYRAAFRQTHTYAGESEQPKVVSGVCVAKLGTQGIILRPWGG